MSRTLLIVALVFWAGCQKTSSSSVNGPKDQRSEPAPTRQEKLAQAELKVLFIGNSHSAPLPGLLLELFSANHPDQEVHFDRAPQIGFLAMHAESERTLERLRETNWDFVVLQAQKYSTSGKYVYPTEGAMKLSKIAAESGAKIIMFPEWSRRDVPDEFERIQKLHQSIAEETGATVAPVGPTWNLASQSVDRNRLYAPDGNHASPEGSYLTACLFYSILTGQPIPENNQAFPSDVEPELATRLETAAWKAAQSNTTNTKNRANFP